MKNIERYVIYSDQPLKDALDKIDINSRGFLVVTDAKNKVVGTLTDGDCRRHLSKSGNLNDTVQNACNTEFAYATDIISARNILMVKVVFCLFQLLMKISLSKILTSMRIWISCHWSLLIFRVMKINI